MDFETVGSMYIKVRGYHLDLYGHVNNARYLEFLEEARWRLVEGIIDFPRWAAMGRAFFVVNINISYRKPAGLGDELEIRSGITRIGNKSAVIRQEIHRTGDGALVTDADVTFVIADPNTQKALPMEDALLGDLQKIPMMPGA